MKKEELTHETLFRNMYYDIESQKAYLSETAEAFHFMVESLELERREDDNGMVLLIRLPAYLSTFQSILRDMDDRLNNINIAMSKGWEGLKELETEEAKK